MQVPLEISFRDVEKTESVENVIREEAAKLEKVHKHINSCRVAVEKPHKHQRSGNPFRIRIDLTVPPNKELVVTREPTDEEMHQPLHTVIKDAFEIARRQLKKLSEQQRGEVKSHNAEEEVALVHKLFRDKGYGFLKTVDGDEIYFHKNSVLHNDFGRLEIGTGVRYIAEMGEKGQQATTVQIVGKPGSRIGAASGSGNLH